MGKLTDDEAAERARQRTRDRISRLKAAGLCVACGVVPPDLNRKQCAKCLIASAAKTERMRRRRLSNGLCSNCGKEPHRPNCKLCPGCLRISVNNLKTTDFERRRNLDGNRPLVIQRDNEQCCICSRPSLTIHHIDGHGFGLGHEPVPANNDPDNLIVLCKGCHSAIEMFLRINGRIDVIVALLKRQNPYHIENP